MNKKNEFHTKITEITENFTKITEFMSCINFTLINEKYIVNEWFLMVFTWFLT
jgi:hypothetical protein